MLVDENKRILFYNKIQTSNTRKDFTKEKLEKYISVLSSQCDNKKLTANDYYIHRKYSIKKYRDRLILVDKKSTSAIPYIYFEEIYDIIELAHLASIHGGLKKTMVEVKKHAVNIKISHVKIYISLCEKCQSLKRVNPIKVPVTKPIISKDFGQRGQVDLIDSRSFKGNDMCNFILNYQDNKTKFCILKPLPDKKPETVISVLEDIFCTFGAPKILHTDNGGEFVNKVLKEYLLRTWPDTNHIRGKPYNPRSQGSVERANRHVKDILKRWYLENEENSLIKSLPYIQFIKNTYFHRIINMTPYEALFGQAPPPISLHHHTPISNLEKLDTNIMGKKKKFLPVIN